MTESAMSSEDTGMAAGSVSQATGVPGALPPGVGSGARAINAGPASGVSGAPPHDGDFGTLPGESDYGTMPGPEDYGTAPGGGRINLGLPNGGGAGTRAASGESTPSPAGRGRRRAAGDGGVNAAAGSEAPDTTAAAAVQTGNYGTIPYGSSGAA